jgi:predicted MarR family transcription regulator
MSGKTKRAIVSSAHLVSEGAAELSEFEYGLMVAGNAFNRWIVRCMAAAGAGDLGALDVMVLHSVNHRARDKKLADICFVLNVEDSHTVAYALRKLAKLGLVAACKSGKETLYATTKEGRAACERYRRVREDCLVAAMGAFAGGSSDDLNRQIGAAADLLRALSGLYDQAARAATSL